MLSHLYVSYCYANNSKCERLPPPALAAPSATVGAMLAPLSPLPWLPCCRRNCHCRRRHCRRHHRRRRHCHCHCYAAISAVTSTISAAIATAFWLIVVYPCAASASATVAFPHVCRIWLPMPMPLLPRPQTTAPCSFRRNRVMFKILLYI